MSAETANPKSVVPNPDPSVLTSAALEKAIENLKEMVEVRFNAMDKAIMLLQQFADKQPTTEAVSLSVEALAELTKEKFAGVEKQFSERDTRIDKTSELNQKALDAALLTAEKAVGKQAESSALAAATQAAAFTKQIDANALLMQTNSKASDDKINDMKAQLAILSGHSRGIGDFWGILLGAVGLITSIIAIMVFLTHK